MAENTPESTNAIWIFDTKGNLYNYECALFAKLK